MDFNPKLELVEPRSVFTKPLKADFTDQSVRHALDCRHGLTALGQIKPVRVFTGRRSMRYGPRHSC